MSSLKTAEYDILTAATIRAVNPSTNLPHYAYSALMSDGQGGAKWSTLSTNLETFYPFEFISTTARLFRADASFNTFRLINADAIRFSTSDYSTSIYAHAFQNLLLSGQPTLEGVSSIRFSTIGNAVVSTTGNTLFFQIPDTFLNTLPISTNIYLVGTNGIRIQHTNQVFPIEISSFTQEGFVALQSNYQILAGRLPVRLTNAYYPKVLFSTALEHLSTDSGVGIEILQQSNSTVQGSTFGAFIEFSSAILSRLHISTLFTVSTLQFSTQQYCSSQLSSFSSLTSLRLESETLASTTNIFGKTTFFSSPTVPLSSFFIVLGDAVNTTSTAISIHNFTAKQSELTSSTKGIISSINALSSQSLSYFSEQASSFSTTLLSTAKGYSLSTGKYVSLHSTIPYITYVENLEANGTGFDITLSTSEFCLSSLSSFISSPTRIFIEYEPMFTFSNYKIFMSSTYYSKNTFAISTFVQMGASTVPGMLHSDTIQTITDIPNSYFQLPMYAPHLRFEIPTSYITKSSFVLTHTLSKIAFINNGVSFRNPDGGIVQVDSFFENCAREITTRTQWTNFMNRSTGVSLYIQNALLL